MNPAHIVLIEDNPGDIYLVKMALMESGIHYALTEFRCGVDAVSELCEPRNENSLVPDAILLDLNTPRTDGFHALTQLKQAPRLSGVPIAILSSSPACSDKHQAEMQGVKYIQKPSGLKEFLRTVGQAVKEMLALRENSQLSSSAP